MKPKATSEGPSSKRLLLYVLGTMITTVAFFAAINSHTAKRMFMTKAEKYEDTVSTNQLPHEVDSTEVNCSVDIWFSRFKANSIAFNDDYTGKQIDVCGPVTDIYMSLSDNAILKIGYENDGNGQVICINEKRSWRNEVKQIKVGDIVHVRGVYYDMMLDPDNIHLKKCHLIY